MTVLLAMLALVDAHAGPVDTARDHVIAHAEVDPGAVHDIQLRRELPWAAGTRVRLQHVLEGIPVEGRDVVVHLDPEGAVRRVRGPVRVNGTLDAEPDLAPTEAVEAARTVSRIFGRGEAWTPRTELVAWLDRDDRPHLAWAVDLASAEPFRQWRVLVDAHDGELLFSRPMSFDARGNVFPSNPVESELTEVELMGLTSETELSGEYADVLSCLTWEGGGFGGGGTCTEKVRWAVPDADGNYLYGDDALNLEDPLAEVHMYHHLDLVSAWFHDEVGFAHATPIQGVVNFPMTNAFFGDADGDGRGDVAFGQGGGVDFAYDADVIYHEYVHSVVSGVTSLGFFGADELGVTFAPLALNEGSADLFSLILTNDPMLGAYAGSSPLMGGGAIRDLGPDRSCPGDLYGEAHEDGMIWGAMGWNIIEDPAVSSHAAMQLFYGTFTSWTDPSMKYADAAASLLETAGDLRDAGVIDQATHDAISGHVEASGLVGCRRVMPLDDGEQPTLFTQYIGVADLIGHIPLTAQFSLEVPEGATEARFKIREWNTVADMGWTIYVRRGEPVEYEVTGVAGFEIPQIKTYDYMLEGDKKGTITLPDPALGFELEPGATYYFSVGTRNLGGISGFDMVQGEVVVSGAVDCCEIPEAKEEAKACGCDSGGQAAGWMGLAGLLALVGRRRRE